MKKNWSQIGALVGFLVLAVTIPFTVYTVSRKEKVTYLSRATGDNGVKLALSPGLIDIPLCTQPDIINNCPKVKLEVKLTTNSNPVSGVDVVLRFDPSSLSIVKQAIAPGLIDDNFNQLLKIFDNYYDAAVDSQTGTIKIKARGSYTGESGVVTSFFVTGIKSGSSTIEIVNGNVLTNGSMVWEASGKNNLLSVVENATVNVK